jgi:DNA polymerase-3 subunit delta'
VTLDAIQGQPRAVEQLRRALAADRVAHAYAFVGPAGSGRATTALALAGALLCARGGCGACRACALVERRQHPDLHVVVPTPPKDRPKGPRAIRIDDIRALERQAALKPAEAERKVFIVDEAERMTEDTPEAFLKTLEEPPPRTVLILVLPRMLSVPATVLSRCQVVRFQPRDDAAAVAARAEAAAAVAEVRAQGAEALVRRAQAFERDREKTEQFVDGCRLLLRDVLVARAGGSVPGAATRLLIGEVPPALAGAWTMPELLAGLDLCRQARAALAVNVTPRLTVEVILNRLAMPAA